MHRKDLTVLGDQKVLVKTQQLTKKYQTTTAVDQVSINVNQGDIYGLIGKNGAGKTTLFKLLLGLSIPTSGEMSLLGENTVSGRRKASRQIGSFVGGGFFPYLSAHENLMYFSKVKGAQSGKKETGRLLKLVNLANTTKPFAAFSMGMKQRLGLAAALIDSPKMIVLDEPVNGLDPEGIVEIRNIIHSLHQNEGLTFLISSHILSELEMIATTFGFLNDGRLVKELSRAELHNGTKGVLYLQVSSNQQAKKILIEKLQLLPEEIILLEENGLSINNPNIKPNLVASHLVSQGVDLYKMQPKGHTLEEYFFELIGR